MYTWSRTLFNTQELATYPVRFRESLFVRHDQSRPNTTKACKHFAAKQENITRVWRYLEFRQLPHHVCCVCVLRFCLTNLRYAKTDQLASPLIITAVILFHIYMAKIKIEKKYQNIRRCLVVTEKCVWLRLYIWWQLCQSSLVLCRARTTICLWPHVDCWAI